MSQPRDRNETPVPVPYYLLEYLVKRPDKVEGFLNKVAPLMQAALEDQYPLDPPPTLVPTIDLSYTGPPEVEVVRAIITLEPEPEREPEPTVHDLRTALDAVFQAQFPGTARVSAVQAERLWGIAMQAGEAGRASLDEIIMVTTELAAKLAATRANNGNHIALALAAIGNNTSWEASLFEAQAWQNNAAPGKANSDRKRTNGMLAAAQPLAPAPVPVATEADIRNYVSDVLLGRLSGQ